MTARQLQRLAFVAAMTAAAAWGSPTTVAVDFSALDHATFARIDGASLQNQAMARLIQDGFALVAPTAHPDILLRLTPAPDGLYVEARAQRIFGRGRWAWGTAPVPEAQRGLVEKLSELAREAQQKPAESATLGDADIGPVDAKAVTLCLGANAVWRSQLDANVTLGVRWGRHLGLGFVAELGFTPSSGTNISVQETSAVVGASYRWWLRERVALDVGARLGMLAESYTLTDPSATSPGGLAPSFLFEAPVELVTWLKSPRNSLAVRAAPGFAAPRFNHTESGQLLWTRSALRLDVGISFQHTF